MQVFPSHPDLPATFVDVHRLPPKILQSIDDFRWTLHFVVIIPLNNYDDYDDDDGEDNNNDDDDDEYIL